MWNVLEKQDTSWNTIMRPKLVKFTAWGTGHFLWLKKSKRMKSWLKMKSSTFANFLTIVCLSTRILNDGPTETEGNYYKRYSELTFKWGNYRSPYLRVLMKLKSICTTKTKRCIMYAMEDILRSPKNGLFHCLRLSSRGTSADLRIITVVTAMPCFPKWSRVKKHLWKELLPRDTCQSMTSSRRESPNTKISNRWKQSLNKKYLKK